MFIAVLIIICLIFFVAALAIVGTLFVQLGARKGLLEQNLGKRKKEFTQKEALLKEIYEASLGLVGANKTGKLTEELGDLEERLRAEQGRLTITQAELDAVDARLRELEEVERELEASAIEAAKELEMLRSQARDLEQRNEALKEQLQLSFDQIDILLSQLTDSQEAQDGLNNMKSSLIETQEKIDFFTENIAELNERYSKLKNAYDALDIEYAQLYEKHNAMGGG